MEHQGPPHSPQEASPSQPASPPFKRRILLINQKLQRQLMAQVGVLIVGIFALFCLSNYLFAQYALQEIERGRLPYDLVRDYQAVMNAVAFLLLVGGIVLVYTFGLRLTHRIAGPIYACIKYLDEVAQGTQSGAKELRLRDKDFFPELGRAINDAVRTLRQKQRS